MVGGDYLFAKKQKVKLKWETWIINHILTAMSVWTYIYSSLTFQPAC